ncbi:MAG: FAD-dependent oxidoreductase, partial [Acidimicrobiia bacterium]
MARIVVIGAGICGNTAALLLARDGHQVTIVDRDDPAPDDLEQAWSGWDRRSVAQFRFAHLMLARGTQILRDELPDVIERLVSNGALQFNVVKGLLPLSGSEIEPADARFDMVTGRRTTIEWALARSVASESRITVRHSCAIADLVTGTEVITGVPHVTGVRLDSGEVVSADLVVDVSGRRSATVRWLESIGAQPPSEHSEDSGFAYYGQFYRSDDGSVPAILAPGLTPFGSMSILTIPSDNGTWSVTLYASSDDAPLRRFREPEVFDRVVRSCPAHAHWLDGTPISELASMTGVVDRSRHFVVDGRPVVTGMVTVADAAACTNPSLGRGMSIGLMHTVVMRDAVRAHLDRPGDLAMAFDDATRSVIEPWHDATRAMDRARNAEMRAIATGTEVVNDPTLAISAALGTAVTMDPVAARAFGELQGCLALPMEVFSRPGLL